MDALTHWSPVFLTEDGKEGAPITLGVLVDRLFQKSKLDERIEQM